MAEVKTKKVFVHRLNNASPMGGRYKIAVGQLLGEEKNTAVVVATGLTEIPEKFAKKLLAPTGDLAEALEDLGVVVLAEGAMPPDAVEEPATA